jgi:predicted RNA methylase
MTDRLRPKSLYYYLTSGWNLLWNSNWWSAVGIMSGKTILFKTKLGVTFWSRRWMDLWTVKEVVIDDVYRFNNIGVQAKDVVIDIGAATGDFSIFAAKKGAVVYAYEPDRDRLELLDMNIKQNNANSVRVRNFGAKSLDDVIGMEKIKSCKFLKVDCEGGEYEIFNHASRKTLKKILNIAMEIHLFNRDMQRGFSDLKSKLVENGFKLTELDNQVHEDTKYLFANK